MSYLNNNIFSPISIKENNFKSYNSNQYKSIDSSSNIPLNRPLYNKLEYDTPLSSISSNQFQLHANNNDLNKYKLNNINENKIKNKNNILNPKDLYINSLKNKLKNLRQNNKDLNNEYQQISKKSQLLINDINKNTSIFSKIKKEYENEIKKNNELKQKCQTLLNNYKKEIIPNNENESLDEFEIDKLKNEQKKLLINIKSKENIINYLQNTLKIITNEIEDNKNENSYNNTKKLNDLNNILNGSNIKFEENKKMINNVNNKNQELNKKIENKINENKINHSIKPRDKNGIINQNNVNSKIILNNNKKELLYQKINDDNNENNLKEKKLNSLINNIEKKNMELEENLNLNDLKNNYNIISSDKNSYKNNFKNIFIDKNTINQYHKRNQSLELEENSNKLVLNYMEDNYPIVNYTLPNSKEEKSIKNIKQKKQKNIKKNKDISKNNNNRNKNKHSSNSSYLFTITKDGKFLEYDILKKIYYFIDTSNIVDWNYFITEYKNNYDGSLLLNTLQGLFILTGKNYSDLYYFSKKYNSISKLNSFNYNHKYGGLILSTDNNSLLALGGERQNNEIFNFESGLIKNLPPLLNKRINSAFTFIGNLLFAFFGKNNSSIEYLNMEICQKWEIINFKINIENKNLNIEEHVAIPVNRHEILILGGKQNTKMMIFNFEEKSLDLTNINIPFIEKVGDYIFNKDKYFNAFIGNDSLENNGSNLNQLIGMDSFGNIHSFNNDFSYQVILFENK